MEMRKKKEQLQLADTRFTSSNERHCAGHTARNQPSASQQSRSAPGSVRHHVCGRRARHPVDPSHGHTHVSTLQRGCAFTPSPVHPARCSRAGAASPRSGYLVCSGCTCAESVFIRSARPNSSPRVSGTVLRIARFRDCGRHSDVQNVCAMSSIARHSPWGPNQHVRRRVNHLDVHAVLLRVCDRRLSCQGAAGRETSGSPSMNQSPWPGRPRHGEAAEIPTACLGS